MLKFLKTAAIAVAMLGSSVAVAEVKLQGAGSTFVNPIMQRWVTDYQKQHPDVKIDYQSIGSGGGIKGILEKTIDVCASDAPMNKKELETAGADMVQIPVVLGSVVPAYNLPDFKGDLKLSGPVLAEIFLGKIAKWNDAKIAALNEGATLPDTGITTAHRTDGSGTTYVFSNYLALVSEDFKSAVGAGKQVSWPGSAQGGKGNDGVTAAVQSTVGAIGYIELNYARANKIPFALMQNKDGKFIKASPETVAAAGEGALQHMTKSLAVSLLNQAGENAYPISSFVYVIVYKDLGYLKDEAKAKALVEYLTWATTEGQNIATEMDYAPLSAGVQKKVGEAIGTLTWSGKPMASAK
jgi:phosphate transport system substrate-binding protein